MTVVVRNDPIERDVARWTVGGFASAEIAGQEAYRLPSPVALYFRNLAVGRILPLVWLSMPVHDEAP